MLEKILESFNSFTAAVLSLVAAVVGLTAAINKNGGAAAPAGGAPAAEAEADFLGGEPTTKTETPKEITDTEIIDATKARVDEVGKEKVIALIKKYGVAKASEVGKEKRADFLKDLGKIKK